MKQKTITQARSLMRATVMLLLALSLVCGTQPAWAAVEEGDQSSPAAEETQVAIETDENAAGDDSNIDDASDALENDQNTGEASDGTNETSEDDQNTNEASEVSEDDTEEDSLSADAESLVSLLSSSSAISLLSTSAQSDPLQEFSGSNRIETSALQALAGWSQSDYIILVGSEGWSDALSAAGLAGALECPILLTEISELADTTADVLTTLQVKHAIVLGDFNAVSDDVISSVEDMGIMCERVGGANRYETNLKVYEYGVTNDLWETDYLVIATGEVFADALSYSPVSYVQKAPVFLANSSGALSSDQKTALGSGAFKQAIILGSTQRVSSTTEIYVKGITSSGTAKRIEGETRYETSALIAEWAVSEGWLSWDKMALTTGEKPYDALGGGALQGKDASVLLLVRDSSDNPTLDEAEDANTTINTVRFFGDKVVVTNIVRMDVADRFGFAYSDIEGLKVYIDAGHGYDSSNNGVLDPGASSGSYQEYILTKDLANRVADVLESTYGIETYVNDDGGYYALRHAEAISLDCDLIVSIHFNSFTSSSATGTESYIHSTNASWKSADLQAKVHSALVSALGLTDRGMKTDQLAVLSGSLPAVLLEICFITNSSDMSTYMSKMDEVAAAIAAGIAS